MHRCEIIAQQTDLPGKICRTFCSPAMESAVRWVQTWMNQAGMDVEIDAACNTIGRSANDERPALLIGSHIDSVPNGGRYDGALGVMFGIAAAEMFRGRIDSLPLSIHAIAFSEEEGVRYRSPYIGSRALANCFDEALLDRVDDEGYSCRSVMQQFSRKSFDAANVALQPSRYIGFFEPHIEQGPVLEQAGLTVGIVDGIAGQTRATARFVGRASHAGTTPMNLRYDAMAAAAEWILEVEKYACQIPGLVATVGYCSVTPNVPNVIAGDVAVRLDTRHLNDVVRRKAASDLRVHGEQIAQRRKLNFIWENCEEQPAVQMDAKLTSSMESACIRSGQPIHHMPSGAGHDAVIMSRIMPTSMLFLRCKGGISHHPDESVDVKDVEVALRVMYEWIEELCRPTAPAAGVLP